MRPWPLLVLGAAAGLAAACATAEPEVPELTPVSELPAEKRELLMAYGRGGAEWAALREEVRRDPKTARWLAENLLLEVFRAYDTAHLAKLGETRGPFERACEELVFLADASTPLLVELLSARDGVVPVVSSELLRRIGEPAVPAVAGALEHPDPRARRAAAELLGDLPGARAAEDAVERRLAELVAADPDWIVRAQAARSLGLRGARHRTTEIARAGLEPALLDADPAVAREAAKALGALEDPAAVPALVSYLERARAAPDPRAADAAQAALRALTGTDADRDPTQWRELWRVRSREEAAPLADPPAGSPY